MASGQGHIINDLVRHLFKKADIALFFSSHKLKTKNLFQKKSE